MQQIFFSNVFGSSPEVILSEETMQRDLGMRRCGVFNTIFKVCHRLIFVRF
jgi:hypothetical protein